MKLATVIALVALSSFAAPVDAAMTMLSASKDTSMFSEDGDRSAGGRGDLYAGATAGNNLRRALLEFDVSFLAGATINSVSVQLTANQGMGGNQDFSLHRVTSDWGEADSTGGGAGGRGFAALPGDATWLDAFEGGAMWATAGGDFIAAASSTASVPNIGTATWPTSSTLVADVQGWVSGSVANHGWIMIGNEGTPQTAKRFHSSEATIFPTPTLIIDFTPVPEPNAALFVSVAIGMVACYRFSKTRN